MRDIHDVTDDIFRIYENIREMFRHWTSEKQTEFISEALKLNPLETELQEITGDWEIAHRINLGIYRSVFPQARSREQTGA